MRRLSILLAVLIILAVALRWALMASVRRNTAMLRKLRGEAMTAFAAHDYRTAVEGLNAYLEKTHGGPSGLESVLGKIFFYNPSPAGADPDAQFAYATARMNVELPNNRHLTDAIHALQYYLEQLRPGDEAAEHELLGLYGRMPGYRGDALHLADDMLAANPRDAEVLKAKAQMLGLTDPAAALSCSEKINEIDPSNLDGQALTQELWVATGVPIGTVLARTQAMQTAHGEDPRFALLLAMAYERAHDARETAQWLKRAADSAPPDAAFALALVRRLDHAQLYQEASAFLARAADALNDPAVQRSLAERLWEDERVEALASRWRNIDPSAVDADPMLVGYRAMALVAQRKWADVAQIADALSHRGDSASAAWTIILQTRGVASPPAPAEAAKSLQLATQRDPGNPLGFALLAESYLGMGESELAIAQCGLAMRLAPNWATPLLIMAQAQGDAGRAYEAKESAMAAHVRAPHRRDTDVMLARTFTAWVAESNLAGSYAQLLPLVSQVQQDWNDPRTLAAYVKVLSRNGKKDEAIAAIRAALAARPPLPAEVLLALSEVSDAEKLNEADAIHQALLASAGMTVEVASAQAARLAAAGEKERGLAVLRDAASGHEREPAWASAMLEYREKTGEIGLWKEWMALGDGNAANLALQELILRSPSRFDDRALWERTIDRVKALTGEQGLLWRIERGRWLLAGDMNERDKADAVNLLTQVTQMAPSLSEPHALLALALEKINKTSGAISELSTAADLPASQAPGTIHLIQLLIAAHRNGDALARLDLLAHQAPLASPLRHWMAQCYQALGDNDKALGLLLDESPAEGGQARVALLADAYHRAGEDEKAAAIYEAAGDDAKADPEFLRQGAEFFASRHAAQASEKLLGRLATAWNDPAKMELLRGSIAERFESDRQALTHYEAAVKAADHSEPAWTTLALFFMRHGRDAQADDAAARGLSQLPESAMLNAIHSDAGALARLGDAANLAPLREALCLDPTDAGAHEMLVALLAGKSNGGSGVTMAAKAEEIAGRYPDDVPLQQEVIALYAGAGRADAALDLAMRLAQRDPQSPRAQQTLAQISLTLGRWDQAEQAAILWRKAAPSEAAAADLALAQVYLSRPNADAGLAAELLKPFATSPGAPAQNPMAVALYARALIVSDQAGSANELLKPLLTTADWRMRWLELSGFHASVEAARAWIETVAGDVPADALDEQLSLARAWYAVGSRFDSSAALDHAARLLKGLVAAHGDSAQGWLLLALTYQAQQNFDAALDAHRVVLKLQPQSANAMNNVAYALWMRGHLDDNPEALQWANAAIAADPSDSTFYDTLARIQARAGDTSLAVSTFRAAIEKDPDNVEAMIGLADLLCHNDSTRAQARELMGIINAKLKQNRQLAPMLRRQYQNVVSSL